MGFLVWNQPRHAAWFSGIGELHAIKLPTKSTKNGRCVRFCAERFCCSTISWKIESNDALHRESGMSGMNKRQNKRLAKLSVRFILQEGA
jgi:hypothetical protein